MLELITFHAHSSLKHMVEIEQQKRLPNVSLDLRPCDKTQLGSEPGARALWPRFAVVRSCRTLGSSTRFQKDLLVRPLVENLDARLPRSRVSTFLHGARHVESIDSSSRLAAAVAAASSACCNP